MERFPSAEKYLTLGIQICPLKGDFPYNPMTCGWDVLTIKDHLDPGGWTWSLRLTQLNLNPTKDLQKDMTTPVERIPLQRHHTDPLKIGKS